MKPDGVTTVMIKSMESGTEPAVQTGSMGEETQQAPPPPQLTEDEKSKPEMGPSAAKVGKSSKPGDLKAKTKDPTKTKAGPPGSKTTGTSGPRSRPSTAQNRTTENRTANTIQKPLTNGVAKKATTTAPEKKKATPTTAPSKTPVGTAGSPANAADRKPIGAIKSASSPSVTNSDKTTLLNKREPVESSGNAKTKTKLTGPRRMSTALSKSSSASTTKPDRPLVSKTTRPATASPALRPMATATAMKVSPSPSKPSPSRPGSAVPSAGQTTATQPPKPMAPVKKDVSNPTAEKLSATSICPSPAKASKPGTPKSVALGRSNSTPKKPVSSGKVGEAKPRQPKQQEPKPPAASRGPKHAAGKATTLSPKKAVGSSTPMPVKRGPKCTQTPTAMNAREEVEAAIPAAEATTVCTVLAAATSAAVTAAGPITAAATASVAEMAVAAVATVGSRSPVKSDVVTQDKLEPELELVHLPFLAVVLGARNTPSPRPAVQPVDEPAGAVSVLEVHPRIH
ncbi:proteoglycan 4-like [Megalops cyprinoides]|uniref:proteoglycan 4-like n=1 Tax=Megalops cyprinoides TaxID=118141 RepID=UPI00186512D0|nr:proteoglycan 4-like [Megalops cyprinoides]